MPLFYDTGGKFVLWLGKYGVCFVTFLYNKQLAFSVLVIVKLLYDLK
jgi:hypothetical protein